MKPAPASARGFTLLEIIVVIGVFSVFAAMAYGGLDRVMLARTRIEQSLNRTSEYQKTYQHLRNDFENAAPRSVRDGDGLTKASFIYDDYTKSIEFTRGGRPNLLNLPRSTLQRVGYFLDDSKIENKKLVRRVWLALDRAPQSEPETTVLLEHVDELKWRFLDSTLTWNDNWPPQNLPVTPATAQVPPSTSATNPNAALNGLPALPPAPRAVEITLRTRDWDEFRLLFKLGPDQLGSTYTQPTATQPTSPNQSTTSTPTSVIP